MILDIVIFIDFNAILPFFWGEGLVALTSQQLKPRKGFGEGFTGVHHGWRWAYYRTNMPLRGFKVLIFAGSKLFVSF